MRTRLHPVDPEHPTTPALRAGPLVLMRAFPEIGGERYSACQDRAPA